VAGRLAGALPLLAEVEALVAARAAEDVPLLVCHSDPPQAAWQRLPFWAGSRRR